MWFGGGVVLANSAFLRRHCGYSGWRHINDVENLLQIFSPVENEREKHGG